MIIETIRNIFLLSIIVIFIQYAAYVYEDNPMCMSIIAYLWGLPLLLSLFIYIVSKSGKEAIAHFTRHSLFGALICIFAMIFVLLSYKKKSSTYLILSTSLITIFSIIIYLYFELYNIL